MSPHPIRGAFVEGPANKQQQRGSAARAGKRIFLILYIVIAAGTTLWAAASVFAYHVGLTEDARLTSSREPKEVDLMACHRDVSGLLADLHARAKQQAAGLPPQKNGHGNVTRNWRAWSRAWRSRWIDVGKHCRLGSPGISPELDGLHDVHRQLDQLHLSYTNVISRFVGPFSERLRTLAKVLDATRAAIEKKKGAKTNGRPKHVAR
jgi:hypothetical protein